MTVIFLFIIGLIIGSFLNVVVMRLRSGESFVTDRSRCPQCKSQLAWHDNIPLISFIMLAGKCRNCKKKISWHYPLAELITALTFASIALRIDLFAQPIILLLTLVFFALLLMIFFYDLRYMEIPMTVLWSACVVVIIMVLLGDLSNGGGEVFSLSSQIIQGLLSGVGAFVFFYALSAYSNETWMGKGDAYVGFVMGIFLGWPNIFIGLLIAFFVGAVVGVVLIALFGKNGKTQIPFGPFMLFGLWVTFFFHDVISVFSDLLQI